MAETSGTEGWQTGGCGEARQGFQWRKLRYSARPCAALFSGWNCVAKILSRASAQVKRPP